MIVKALTQALSPGGSWGRLSILIFHRVLAEPDPILGWDPGAKEFKQMMGWVRAWFNVLPLEEAVARLNDRSLPPRAAAITFDDGYADNATIAMPILKSHGLPATFFITTGYLDGGRMWNDTIIEAVRHCRMAKLDLSGEDLGVFELASAAAIRQSIDSILARVKYLPPKDRLRVADYIARVAGSPLPSNLMLNSEQVRSMYRAGMSIGAHTVTHPILSRVDPMEAYTEILESKQFLESLLQERVSMFAYPNGKPDVDYRLTDQETVRRLGFTGAVTTAWGVADTRSDPMQLPRFTPWDKTRLRFAGRLLENLLLNPRRCARQRASRPPPADDKPNT